MVAAGEPGALATVIATRRSTPRHEGSRMIVLPDGGIVGRVGGGSAEAAVVAAALEVLDDGRCRRVELDLAGDHGVCGGWMEVFIEPVLQTDPFWIVGAGHVGRAVVEVGRTLPFRFVLVDDRPEVLAGVPDHLPARRILAEPGAIREIVEVDPRGALLMASRSADLDGAYLEEILAAEGDAGKEFPFLGGIASRTKAGLLRRRLAEAGVDPLRLKRLQLPVGLAVGAETPAEIAVSILAEALAVLRGVDPLPAADGGPGGLPFQRTRKKP
jgi:xanthine dehydrogenase accessory factor